MEYGKMTTKKRILTVLSCVIIAGGIVAFLPSVRDWAVWFAEEKVKHESIDEAYWNRYLFNGAIVFTIIALLILAVQYTKKASGIYSEIRTAMKSETAAIGNKKTVKLFWYMSLFLIFAYFPLIHANVYQVPIDDLRRSLTGSRDFVGFFRYVDEYVGIFVHTSTKFVDIAPLTQFLGIGVLSLTAVLLAGIFTDFHITFISLAAAVPAVLSPWFLADMTYRVDSPYMALSLLVEIVPFLFTKNIPAYIFASVVGNLLMCTTYQSSAGIYVVMTISLAFFRWAQGKKTGKETWKFIGISAACFLITLGFFKIIFDVKKEGGYVNTAMLPLSSIVPGTIANIGTYLKCLAGDLGHGAIALLFPVISLLYVVNTTRMTCRNKTAAAILSIVTLVFITAISFGVYLVLELPLWNSRAFTGIGIVFSVTTLMAAASLPDAKQKKICWTAVFTVFFAYSFVAFSYMYGNAQSAQKMYTESRTNALLADLNEYCPNPAETVFQFDGNIGWAPQTDVPNSIYPLIRRDMNMNLEDPWGCLFIMKQHGYGKFSAHEIENIDNIHIDLKSMNLPVLKDTGLHTIRGDGKNFYITLKPYRGK
jgi:hypothetical protein